MRSPTGLHTCSPFCWCRRSGGLRLGLLTSAMSAAAFNFFHLPPTGEFTLRGCAVFREPATTGSFAPRRSIAPRGGPCSDRALQAAHRCVSVAHGEAALAGGTLAARPERARAWPAGDARVFRGAAVNPPASRDRPLLRFVRPSSAAGRTGAPRQLPCRDAGVLPCAPPRRPQQAPRGLYSGARIWPNASAGPERRLLERRA